MARRRPTDKMLIYAKRIGVEGKTLKLLTTMAKDSINTLLPDYSCLKEGLYVESIFDGSRNDYLESLKILIEENLITYNAYNDTMIVLAQQIHHLNNLIFGLKAKRKKRNYKREPQKQQAGLFNILTSGSLGRLVTNALIKASSTISEVALNPKYKESGFRIYEPWMPYFIGKPLDEKDKEVLIKYNPELLELEQRRRGLKRETMRVLCACLAFMGDNKLIEDSNRHSLLQSVIKEFGESSFCIESWYNGFAEAKEVKLLSEEYDEEKKCNCIKVHIETTGKRFVIVPFVPLEDPEFKKMEISGIKQFFEILFNLNNGESKDKYGNAEYIGQSKPLYLKVDKLDIEDDEKKRKFEEKLNLQLKKRYPGEYRRILFGDLANKTEINADADGEEKAFKALLKYFHFQYLPTPSTENGKAKAATSLIVRVRKEYFISKKAEMVKKQLSLQGRYRRKTQVIKDYLSEYEIEYTADDLLSFIKTFKRASRKTIKFILSLLAVRIGKIHTEGLAKINSLGAYVHTLYKNNLPGAPPAPPDLPEIRTDSI